MQSDRLRQIVLQFLFVISSVCCLKMSFSRFSLKQSVNIPALKMISDIIQKPELAVPRIELDCLSKLNVQKLKRDGIKYIVFDKDNTLCCTYTDSLHESVIDKVIECKHIFTPSAIAILSNSVGTKDDNNYSGAIATEAALDIPVIRHDHKKPGCLAEVLAHFQACSKSKDTIIDPKKICVIGDRLLTDVVFANQYNMRSVLVRPLSYIKDHPIAALIRFFEVFVLLPLLKLCGYKSKTEQ